MMVSDRVNFRIDPSLKFIYEALARKYGVPFSGIIRTVLYEHLKVIAETEEKLREDIVKIQVARGVAFIRRNNKFKMSMMHLGNNVIQRMFTVYYNNLGATKRNLERKFRSVVAMAEDEYKVYPEEMKEMCADEMIEIRKFKDVDHALTVLSENNMKVRSDEDIWKDKQRKITQDIKRLGYETRTILENTKTGFRGRGKGKNTRKKA